MPTTLRYEELKDHLGTKLTIAAGAAFFSGFLALLIIFGVITFPIPTLTMSIMLALIAIATFAVRFAISYRFERTQLYISAKAEEQAEALAKKNNTSPTNELETARVQVTQEHYSKKSRVELILLTLSFLTLVALISLSAYGLLPILSTLEVVAMSMVAASIVYIKFDLFLKGMRDQITVAKNAPNTLLNRLRRWFSDQNNQGKFIMYLGLGLAFSLAALVAIEVSMPISIGMMVFSNVPLLLGFTVFASAICLRGFVLYSDDPDAEKRDGAHKKAAAVSKEEQIKMKGRLADLAATTTAPAPSPTAAAAVTSAPPRAPDAAAPSPPTPDTRVPPPQASATTVETTPPPDSRGRSPSFFDTARPSGITAPLPPPPPQRGAPASDSKTGDGDDGPKLALLL